MDIKYLTVLNEHKTITSESGYVNVLEPISIEEIGQLEIGYNNGNVFPTALSELLFLAGEYCYCLEFGIYQNQADMQRDVRKWLTAHNKAISRPFFAIDVYNGYDQFLFVYLDEGVDDPTVNEARLDTKSNDEQMFVSTSTTELSKFIESRVIKIVKGYNPF